MDFRLKARIIQNNTKQQGSYIQIKYIDQSLLTSYAHALNDLWLISTTDPIFLHISPHISGANHCFYLCKIIQIKNSEMRKIDFIDFNRLKKTYPQDKVFQRDIVDTFIKRTSAYSYCLKVSLERGDTEELLAYSCQLRGIAECCCVQKIEKLCLKLDGEVQERDRTAATMTVQRIRSILRSIQEQYSSNLNINFDVLDVS